MKNRNMVVTMIVAGVLAVAGWVYATSQTNTVGGASGYPVVGMGNTYKLAAMVDFALMAPAASNDTIQVIAIPGKSRVLGVSVWGNHIATNARPVRVMVGDTTSATRFIDGWTSLTNTPASSVYTNAIYIATNTSIVVTFDVPAGASNGVMQVRATVADEN